MTVKELNSKYAIEGCLSFVESKGGMAIAMLSNDHSFAQVSLYGAHVLTFEPAEQDDVLMMSNKSYFEKGKPMRGGIPLCFPWFGPHATDKALPPHGFARLMDWNVKATAQQPDGATCLVLSLTDNEQTRAMWPHAFECDLTIVAGKTLDMSWSVKNTGSEAFEIASAMHTYFATNDVTQINIKGLEGVTYLDATQQLAPVTEGTAPVVIDREVNRCYMDTTATCEITDPSMDRTIRVAKTGSQSTVVWNPWKEVAKTIADLEDNEYQGFVCLETANVHRNKVTVAPGAEHAMSLSISTL